MEAIKAQLARIEAKIDKLAPKTLADYWPKTDTTPAPKPAPKGKITYPLNGSLLISGIPNYYTYKKEVGDMPSWEVDGKPTGLDGGQVAFEVSAGEHTVSAVVDGKVVDSIKVMGFVPER